MQVLLKIMRPYAETEQKLVYLVDQANLMRSKAHITESIKP